MLIILTKRCGSLRGAYFLLLQRASVFVRGFCCPLGKKELIMLFWPFFGNFWCPVVTLVNFNSNLSNFSKNPKFFLFLFFFLQKFQKSKKNPKNSKIKTKYRKVFFFNFKKIYKKSKKSIKKPKSKNYQKMQYS